MFDKCFLWEVNFVSFVSGTFKFQKTDMRHEGFDPNVVSDKLYFLDCTKGQYVELNVELHRNIVSGKQKLWDHPLSPPIPSLAPPLIAPPLVTSATTVRGRRNTFWPHIQADSYIHHSVPLQTHPWYNRDGTGRHTAILKAKNEGPNTPSVKR